MNSRRLMGLFPKAKITTDYSSFRVGLVYIATKRTHDRLVYSRRMSPVPLTLDFRYARSAQMAFLFDQPVGATA
jgi:hypothetical protein